MDDETESLEVELKALTPVAPSPAVAQRIAAELTPIQSRLGRPAVRWVVFAAFPIAAALVVLLSQSRHTSINETHSSVAPQSANGRAPDVLKPVAVENVLYAATDEGVVTLDDGTTARRERLNYVDTIKWQNPRTHASLTWSIPREEVRVVPVRYQ